VDHFHHVRKIGNHKVRKAKAHGVFKMKLIGSFPAAESRLGTARRRKRSSILRKDFFY
jgi:hypothetical protein